MTNPDIKKIDYTLQDQDFLIEALTHKSWSNENVSEGVRDNERMEFLGDAVLEFVITDLLLKHFPGINEGVLSKYRSDIVNEHRLADLARNIELGPQIRLGKGEKEAMGFDKGSILSDAFEAVLAAIYYDGGIEAAYKVIQDLFIPLFPSLDTANFSRDYKSRLQELTQQRFKMKPFYNHTGETGPDHDKSFQVELKVGPEHSLCSEGSSKKLAEQNAARKMLEKLENII